MKRGKPLKRKARISPRSGKQQSYQEELEEMRPLVMARALHVCEKCRAMPAVVIHHKLRRSQGGTNDLGNLMALCLDCHNEIHEYPAWSYEKGWLLRRSDQDKGERE